MTGTATRVSEIELRNQYRYQDGNVTYEYSVGVSSPCSPRAYCADLDMGSTPDEDEDQDEGEGKGDSDGDDGDLDPTKDSLPPSDEAVDEDEAPSKVVFSKKGSSQPQMMATRWPAPRPVPPYRTRG